MAANACPNCGRKFVLRPNQRWCNEACQIEFWENEYQAASSFLSNLGLYAQFREWRMER